MYHVYLKNAEGKQTRHVIIHMTHQPSPKDPAKLMTWATVFEMETGKLSTILLDGLELAR